jgi:hypothetical protein
MALSSRPIWRSWSFLLSALIALLFAVVAPIARMAALNRLDLAAIWLGLTVIVTVLLWRERFGWAFFMLVPAIAVLLQMPLV